jgi:hypothetical protein
MRNSAPLVEQPRDDSIPSVYRFQGRFFVVKYSVFLFFAITPPAQKVGKTGKAGKTGNSFRIEAFSLYSEFCPLSVKMRTEFHEAIVLSGFYRDAIDSESHSQDCPGTA